MLWAFLIAIALLAAPTFGHNTSKTRIDVNIRTNGVDVTLALNQSDLLEHVLNAPHGENRFADRTEFEDAAPKILAYVIDHFPASADGKPLAKPTAREWPPQHAELTHLDESGLETPSVIPLTLHFVLPPGASHVELQPRLFSGPNFAAIFEVSIYPGNGAAPIRTVCDKHQPIRFDLTSIPPGNVGAGGRAIISESPPGFIATLGKFFSMGFHHIIPDGLDHILFVLGLYFLSPKLSALFWQVTAFTIAHSITLALAAFHKVNLPPRIIEPLIALSITVVAVENLFRRGVSPWRWALVFCFGLIHGMGFADILRETRLPTGEAFTALFSFNVGVEAGQISILLAAMALTIWWQKRTWYFRFIAAPASILIACTGAFWTVQRIMHP
ncbi:MAG TPA: HupE/UreJ family protein [Humisphaera sp.]|nr:HupE/UreJ family protein [Humisphaera sp.]